MTRAAVLADVDQYAASEYARGRSDGQAAQSTSDQAVLAALQASDNAKIAALEAQLSAGGMQITEFADFNPVTKAGITMPDQFYGRGSSVTGYRMKAHSSTAGPAVQAIEASGKGTNPYTAMVFGGNDAGHIATDLLTGGWSLLHEDQGHDFNGVRIGYSKGALVYDVYVEGAPGSGPGNPRESFLWNVWHAEMIKMVGVHLDGLGMAASGFGFNNLDSTYYTEDCSCHNTKYGNGATHWKCLGGGYHKRLDVSNNHKPLNYEDCTGMHTLERPNLRGKTGGGPPITVNANNGSAKLLIIDPIVDSWPLPIGVSTLDPNNPRAGYYPTPPGLPGPNDPKQTQRIPDIQLVDKNGAPLVGPNWLRVGNVW